MEIIFDPKKSKSNQYVILLTSLFSESGLKIHSVSEAFSSFKKFKSIKIAHLNWYENLTGSSKIEHLFSFIKKILKLFLLKIFNKKIVWTMHNKLPHDQKTIFLKKILIRVLLSISDKIIIHSRSTTEILDSFGANIKRKIQYVPHPDYIQIYGDRILKNVDIQSSVLNLLFMGAVKPYKNIELLIDAAKSFPNDVKLTIAGNPSSQGYKTLLEKHAENTPNITLDLRFIPDEQIPEYLNQCDLLALPYDMKSSLNSGTVILAFSYGKTVICPEIGTISDFKDTENILSYTYASQSEHIEKLKSKIGEAINYKRSNNNAFNVFGENMFNKVMINNNKVDVASQLLGMYRRIA